MNSLRNTVKYLHLISVKAAVSSLKELKPNHLKNIPKDGYDLSKAKTIFFAPRSIGVEIGQKPKEDKSKQDPLTYTPITNPRSILPLIDTNWRKDEIGLPTPEKEEIQCARLLVIRRKKMKKHKRRKLWKKMRHRWARVKQHRRQIKEKRFQAELLAMVNEAEKFSAEQYVADKIARVNHTPLPTRWKGKRLPEFIIRQLMGLDKKINYKHSDVYKA